MYLICIIIFLRKYFGVDRYLYFGRGRQYRWVNFRNISLFVVHSQQSTVHCWSSIKAHQLLSVTQCCFLNEDFLECFSTIKRWLWTKVTPTFS
jgi:hypothetical protein